MENNEATLEDGVPHLVYISRQKMPNIPHHHKAGAMNVLVIKFSFIHCSYKFTMLLIYIRSVATTV